MKGGNFASSNQINQFIIQSEKADKERDKLGITGNEGKSEEPTIVPNKVKFPENKPEE